MEGKVGGGGYAHLTHVNLSSMCVLCMLVRTPYIPSVHPRTQIIKKIIIIKKSKR